MEVPNFRKTQVSYLRARDPSIISGYVKLDSVKVALVNAKFEDSSSLEEIPEFVQIYLRIKNTKHISSQYEYNNNTIISNLSEGNSVSKEYEFDKIFGPETTQEDLFNGIIKRKLFHFINGKSSTLLTYGASGSGKTFTMFGTIIKPGIIPRAFEYLFRTLHHIPEDINFKPDCNGDVIFLSQSALQEERRNRRRLFSYFNSVIDEQHIQTYGLMQERLSVEPVGTVDHQPDVIFGVWISFAEIYNESIFDLLNPKAPGTESRTKLNLGKFNGQTFIKSLTSVNVFNGMEAYQILQYGLRNLKYAETSINRHSSRSHSIFTIKLLQGSRKDKNFTISYFNFCDLAGSERVKKTLNIGERLKESNNINTSLHVLGKCIKCLRESQKNNDKKLIPFRESKLTQLFQNALLGLEDIALIINMNPDASMFDETRHVLGFSVNAREIRLAKTDSKPKDMFDNIQKAKLDRIEKLRTTIASLQLELEEQMDRNEEEESDLHIQTLAEVHEVSEQHKKTWADHLKDVDKLHKKRFLMKLEDLRNEYKHRFKNDTSVISLDDSDDQ